MCSKCPCTFCSSKRSHFSHWQVRRPLLPWCHNLGGGMGFPVWQSPHEQTVSFPRPYSHPPLSLSHPRTSLSQKLFDLGLPFPEVKMLAGITQDRLRLACGVSLNSLRLLAWLPYLSCQNKFPPTHILGLSGLPKVTEAEELSYSSLSTFTKGGQSSFILGGPQLPHFPSSVSSLPILTKG